MLGGNDPILEMYSNEKDINEINICAGDIIDLGYKRHLVKFGPWEYEEDFGGTVMLHGFNFDFGAGYPEAERADIEVVGNVHENPELMK